LQTGLIALSLASENELLFVEVTAALPELLFATARVNRSFETSHCRPSLVS
jgi:hypothetical protein